MIFYSLALLFLSNVSSTLWYGLKGPVNADERMKKCKKALTYLHQCNCSKYFQDDQGVKDLAVTCQYIDELLVDPKNFVVDSSDINEYLDLAIHENKDICLIAPLVFYYGANPCERDDQGISAMDSAYLLGRNDLIQFFSLLPTCRSLNTEMKENISQNDLIIKKFQNEEAGSGSPASNKSQSITLTSQSAFNPQNNDSKSSPFQKTQSIIQSPDLDWKFSIPIKSDFYSTLDPILDSSGIFPSTRMNSYNSEKKGAEFSLPQIHDFYSSNGEYDDDDEFTKKCLNTLLILQ